MANKVQMPSREEFLAAFEEMRALGPDMIPQPKGWRMLVMMPKIAETTKGGIILTDKYVDDERLASPIGLVVAQGPLCYDDKKKFSDGERWCEVGDIIVFRSYTGTRLVIHEHEFRMISDESVEGVVADPRGLERI